MQRSPQPESQQVDILTRVLKAVDRRAKAASWEQRVILLGTGAMYDWGRGRQQFRKMREAIERDVPKCLGEGWIVDIHWLGYPKMDAPFETSATLSSVELGAAGIQQAVGHFPNAVFDFVCHSLSGLIALYWSLTPGAAKVHGRINSIVTINSPLKSYSAFHEACKRHLENYGTLFGQSGIPSAVGELRDDSSVTSRIVEWGLPIHLLNVCTVGDEIVPRDFAEVRGAKDRYQFHALPTGGALDKHRQALLAEEVHKKVVDTICAYHLA